MAKQKPELKPATKTTTGDITVRMFCQGLGDCFLISIPQEGNQDYQILIDCGVAMGTTDAAARMQDVVQQINEITGGVIDVLVITHEHWDHVSGFTQAQEAFKELKAVNHLWMAWTEDPKDDLARDLKKQYGKTKQAALQALTALEGRRGQPGMDKIRRGVEGLLAFYGHQPAWAAAKGSASAKKSGGGDLDGAMKIAKALVGTNAAATSFLMPGETHALPNAAKETTAAGIKVRVLGPPHDGPMVCKLDKAGETYDKQQAHFGGVTWAWTGALAANLTGGLTIEQDAAMPFEKACRIPLSQAKRKPFFKAHYYNSPKGCQPREAKGFELRRIDGDWLARGAQQLSLWINRYTNNVSLVLAFELPKTGKVLLFVGDAQVGNWLSWREIKTFKDSANQPVSMQDLFKSTVLYKVGHHGSHNATLREKGLELMTHPELVAMLPVDEVRASALGYGEMPLKSLLAAIDQRADQRLLRLDKPWKNDATPGEWPTNLAKAKLVQRPQHIVPFMEYTVHDK